MKLSDNMIREVRFHLVFMVGPLCMAPCLWLAYQCGLFYTLPAWVVFCLGVFMTVGLYVWFRQGLSSDKTSYKVRIW